MLIIIYHNDKFETIMIYSNKYCADNLADNHLLEICKKKI